MEVNEESRPAVESLGYVLLGVLTFWAKLTQL